MTSAELEMFQTVALRRFLTPVLLAALVVSVLTATNTSGKDSAKKKEKLVIGSTATVTETSSGVSFPARIDTGAETCSLHVEKVQIDDKTARRLRNVGKTARFLIKDNNGKTHWVEAIIADAVRIKSSSLKVGEYDHRYKVRLTLQWKDFTKEVLVTLNDRTDMEYPLLLGRNFLSGDFLVDVAQDGDQG
jgi:hypothetical protein